MPFTKTAFPTNANCYAFRVLPVGRGLRTRRAPAIRVIPLWRVESFRVLSRRGGNAALVWGIGLLWREKEKAPSSRRTPKFPIEQHGLGRLVCSGHTPANARVPGLKWARGRSTGLLLAAWMLFSVPVALVGAEPEASALRESFELVGALPDEWQTVYNDDSAPNFYEPEVVTVGGNANYLKLQSGKSIDGAPFRQPAIINTGSKFQNLEGSVVVRFPRKGNDRAGVIIRAQEVAYNPLGYAITLRTNYGSTPEEGADHAGPVFMLGVVDASGHPTRSIRRVDLGEENFAPETDYELRFAAKGDLITAEAWTTGDNPYQLGQVAVTDSRHGEAGHVGLRLSSGNSDSAVFFRNLVVESAAE